MIALLLPHTGAHRAARPPFFRRLRLRRKQAPGGVAPGATALLAAPSAVSPEHRGFMRWVKLSAPASIEARRRALQHANLMHAGYAAAVDRLRREAGLPTVDEMRTEYFAPLPQRKPMVNRQPWQTAEFPALVFGQAPQLAVLAAERGLSPDCGTGCHAPLCDGRNCSCPCHAPSQVAA